MAFNRAKAEPDETLPGMTVKELIELLKDAPPDARVFSEGCDCYGSVDSVEVGNYKCQRVVVLTRS